MSQVQCQQCAYVWTPRKVIEDIRMCPNCKSRKWREKKEKTDGEDIKSY